MVEPNPDKIVDVTGSNSYELIIDWSAVKRDPQARQRVSNLLEIAFSILR